MKYIKFIFLGLFLSNQVFAWGPTGHRVVGEVAQRHLTKSAAENLKVLLGGLSLAEVATWADEIRSIPEFDPLKPLHFANILPPFKTYAEKAAADVTQDPKGDVILATMELELFLRTNDPKVLIPIPALGKVDRMMAVKLLVHFVGDIHQPLHLIDALDKEGKSIQGGNTVKVNWMNKWSSNLHSVWDDEIIDQEKLTYEELATFVDHSSSEDQKLWSDASVMDWANESLGYREQVFTYPDKQIEGQPIFISFGYISANRPAIRLRLEQAGIRLAAILNSIF